VAISPDNHWLVAGSNDNTARLWDLSAVVSAITKNRWTADALIVSGTLINSSAVAVQIKGISPLSGLAPLELFQIDHTPVDVIVVDEQDRLPVGRPWALVIDVGSRVAAGFCVSIDDPSTLSVARALTHAVTPKDKWLFERGVDVEWPVAGIPKALHLDNAKEFESSALVRGCQEYGIELKYRPPGRPHFGGHVERLIGTMMGAVHLLPGTTFSNVRQKGECKSETAASLTLAELERWLVSAPI
jgi:putative transposase